MYWDIKDFVISHWFLRVVYLELNEMWVAGGGRDFPYEETLVTDNWDTGRNSESTGGIYITDESEPQVVGLSSKLSPTTFPSHSTSLVLPHWSLSLLFLAVCFPAPSWF